MRIYNAKPPVKPIGRILYSQTCDGDYRTYPARLPTYEKVCECRGFSDDKPFSVYRASSAKDKNPWKVVFFWTNEHPKKKKVRRLGEDREETDYDTYIMLDILEEHTSKSAAQKAMRRFADEAFAKVNKAPTGEGAKCHNTWHDDNKKEHPLHVGDLISYAPCPGIVWKVMGERRTRDAWFLQVEPVLSFLVFNGTNKRKELGPGETWGVKPINIIDLGTTYSQLATLAADEAKRLSK